IVQELNKIRAVSQRLQQGISVGQHRYRVQVERGAAHSLLTHDTDDVPQVEPERVHSSSLAAPSWRPAKIESRSECEISLFRAGNSFFRKASNLSCRSLSRLSVKGSLLKSECSSRNAIVWLSFLRGSRAGSVILQT